ncbi:hypothetical protein C7377_1599 [Balneicella halophila]|uniref:Uncharacterized protein n=1 Tax=Balneicella halophila TaxID=1537566 RepID=A0A7L4UN41_BALHA|nr:hypothetical protein [Balneicella halophila]PVX49959.1 hypothetical protein C7377_1599 [Balneicella halophila]
MKNLLLSFFFLMITSSVIKGANDHHAIGARATALGHSSISFKDLWSIVNNQAGMAFIDRPTLGVSYEERFMMKEMSLKTVAFILPTNRVGNFGFSYTHFGDSEFNEFRINVGYAMPLGEHFAMGLAFDYLGMSVSGSSESGHTGTVTGELGIMGEPIENLWLSAHAYNPFGVSISDYEYEEPIPTILSIGALYHFTEDVFFLAEVEKDIDYDTRVKAGIEYRAWDKLFLRGGITTNPTEFSGGIGVELQNFKADLAFYKHQYLGYTPSISLSYAF